MGDKNIPDMRLMKLIIYSVLVLLNFLFFYMLWTTGLLFGRGSLFLPVYIGIPVCVYIGGWAQETVKKRRTVSHIKINLAVSVLFLDATVLTIAGAYNIYLYPESPFFLYARLVGMTIVYWVGGCITYTLLKRKLIPNRIYIPVSLALVVLFFTLFGLHFSKL